jgi:hypothetical protein
MWGTSCTTGDRPLPPTSYESYFAIPLSHDELAAHQQRYLAMPTY